MATTQSNERIVLGDNVERAEGTRSEGVAVVTTILPGHNMIAVRWRNDPKHERIMDSGLLRMHKHAFCPGRCCRRDAYSRWFRRITRIGS